MRELYLDCFAGISGNMILGALLDLGLPVDDLLRELRKLPLGDSKIIIDKVQKKGITATYFDVEIHPEHHHRNLQDIMEIIDGVNYDLNLKREVGRCFKLLAEAEAKIHGVGIEEIHFHEVGAIDAIVDIVGSCWGLLALGLSSIKVSPVRVGYGSIHCAHGFIPLPAPAALELLKGYSIYSGDLEGEWATPTGAAILRNFATPVSGIPSIKTLNVGYGAGASERSIPNVLRIILGENDVGNSEESQIIVETNIDDMNPEIYGYLGELLLESGARDYYFTPVYMKKGRPGTLLTVVVSSDQVSKVEDIIMKETTTLGIRKYSVKRKCLAREQISVDIGKARISVKVGYLNKSQYKLAPEYEDCRRIARDTGRSIMEIYQEAMVSAKKIMKERGTSEHKSE